MNLKIITLALSVSLLAISCGTARKNAKSPSQDLVHNAQTSLDWAGTYKGILPSASGEGIETAVVLRNDMTCTYHTKYIGKNDSPQRTNGSFSWSDTQPGVILLSKNPEGSKLYFVAEGALIHLDQNGKRIEGALADNYRLAKEPEQLSGHIWVLSQLNGIEMESRQNPNLAFDAYAKIASGSAGCNRYTGGYSTNGNSLKFGNMAATMMMCPDMEIEQRFLKMLPEVAEFVVKGNVLELMDKDSKVVAKFTKGLISKENSN